MGVVQSDRCLDTPLPSLPLTGDGMSELAAEATAAGT